MKRFLIFTLLTLFIGCQNLVDLEPSETETYVKFLGDLGDNFGVKVKETPEGDLICLGYNVRNDTTRTLLFKTNVFGNVIWTSPSVHAETNFRAVDINIGDDGGYYIIGDSINNVSLINSIMLLKTNSSGDIQSKTSVNSISAASEDKNFVSTAVYARNDAEIIGLGYWEDGDSKELFYLQFSFTDLTGYEWVQEVNSTFSYDPGKSMIKDNVSQEYVWVASALEGQAFKAAGDELPGQQETLSGVSFAVDIAQSTRNDHFGGIGNDGNGNVVFYDLSQSMNLVDSHILTVGEALSISAVSGGGYAILTTSGGNFTLHKTTNAGNVNGPNDASTFSRTFDWTSNESDGAAIGVSDGEYVVLGTSRAGIASMIVLVKTNSKGEL